MAIVRVLVASRYGPRVVEARAGADPQRAVAQRLDLAYDAGAVVAAAPDSDLSEVHTGSVAGSGAGRGRNARNQPATPAAISDGMSGTL